MDLGEYNQAAQVPGNSASRYRLAYSILEQ